MPGELQQRVGRNVRALRKQMGLSQAQFGAHFDYDRTFIGHIERGERNLTVQSVERLAELFEVDPVDLLLEPSDLEIRLERARRPTHDDT